MYVSLNGLKDSARDVTVLTMNQVIVSCELPKILNSCRRILTVGQSQSRYPKLDRGSTAQ